MTIAITFPPTPEQFYIEFPLYQEFTFTEDQFEAGWKIKYFGGTIDAFCPACGSHSIFSHNLKETRHPFNSWTRDHMFDVQLTCSRVKKHCLYFLFQVHNETTMQKIGQFPSLATVNLYDVRKYRTVLNNTAFREIATAIGLAAHGVGIGSFVYLRRIFEGLVEEAHVIAQADSAWNDELYARSRMAEKIQLLSHLLPMFLAENKAMYSILSKGIHELSEDECLTAFPVVKVGIEIILDAKIHAEANRKKLEAARLAIQSLASQRSQ